MGPAPIKPLEDVQSALGRDRLAGVSHRHVRFAVIRAGINTNAPFRLIILDRVLEQVLHDQ